MIKFLKNYKSQIIKLTIMLVILVALSIISLVALESFGVIYHNEEGLQINAELFDSFRNSWYSWIVLILIKIASTILLCFIPGISMAYVLLTQVFFEHAWQAFLVSLIGVFVSSFLMYFIGRLGGYRICSWILGKEDCKKAMKLLNNKGAIYFPIMMVFPVFPDDALVMIAGTIKMSMKWFLPGIILGRGIGIATMIFGIGKIPYDKFTTPWHWIAFVLICAVVVIAVFYTAYRFNKFLERRNKNKHQHLPESKNTEQ